MKFDIKAVTQARGYDVIPAIQTDEGLIYGYDPVVVWIAQTPYGETIEQCGSEEEGWVAAARRHGLTYTPEPTREQRLEQALRRIAEANPRSTNSASADEMASWCQAVANTALNDD